MLYNPVTAFIETTRKLFKSRVRDAQLAYLGDGTGRVEVPDRRGYVYIRFPGGKDANGFATFSTPGIARSSGAAFLNFEGAAVYVAIGYNDEFEIVSANYQQLDQSGIDTRVLNPLHQQSKWVYLWQLTIGLATAVATTTTGSLLVSVKKYLHYVNNTFQFFEIDDLADKVNLSSYIPATDMQRYAAVWIDTYTNTAHVTTSTTQSLFTTLDDIDIQELVAQRPPDAIPHKAFYLANNQGTITQNPVSDIDLRQFLNMPPVIGFQSPVAYRERIQPGRQQLFTGSLVVTGSLEVLGSLVGLCDETGGGDSGGGAPVAATYITQTPHADLTNEQALSALATGLLKNANGTGVLSIATPVTDYGTMSSFDIDADTGAAANIGNGELVEVLGDGQTTETSIAANVITVALRSAVKPKMQSYRFGVSSSGEVGQYSTFTDLTEMDFILPEDAETDAIALPVSGVWNYFDGSDMTQTIEFARVETGDVTNTSAVITAMSSTVRLAVGMKIAGTGINAAATILTVDSATQITMTHTATATNAGVSLTFTFPTTANYDVYLKVVGGVPTPCYRKWTTSDTFRGWFPVRLDGVFVDDVDGDKRLMGSLRATATGFQFNPTHCLIGNLYHRYPFHMYVADLEDNWSYTTATWRQARATAANKFEIVTSVLAPCEFQLVAYATISVASFIGIGHNSTTTPAASQAGKAIQPLGSADAVATWGQPLIGYNTVVWLEKGAAGSVFRGDNGTDMNSALSGWVMA